MKTQNHNTVHDRTVALLRRQLEDKGYMTIHLCSYTARKIRGSFIRIPLRIEKGWPDIIAIKPNGDLVFFEVKTGKGVLNDDQRNRFTKLARRGARIYIVDERLQRRLFKSVYRVEGKHGAR